jgi:hypothetical protein
MDSGLPELMSAAATTLVAAMTTDSWQQVKAAFVRLWRRRPELAEAVSADLADARSAAIAANDEHVGAELVAEWQSRLRRLVVGDEELQNELRRFTEETGRLLGGRGDSNRISMKAEVHGSGRVYQAGRDQTVTDG